MKKHAGRHGSVWRRLSANQRAKGLPCRRCGQPIDYRLQYPDPASFSCGHIIARSVRPDLAEDPDNLCSEHLRCGQSGGSTLSEPVDLGVPSEEW